MKFRDTPQYKRGDFGEQIVKKWLEEKGYITYSPDQENKAHAFDFLTTWKKKHVAIVEVKTKPRRLYYTDTGIDIKSYYGYKGLVEQGLKVYIAFVDEKMGCIYIGNLSVISEPIEIDGNQYPMLTNGIIYFHLGNITDGCDIDTGMKVIYWLSDEQLGYLRSMKTTRKYNYGD